MGDAPTATAADLLATETANDPTMTLGPAGTPARPALGHWVTSSNQKGNRKPWPKKTARKRARKTPERSTSSPSGAWAKSEKTCSPSNTRTEILLVDGGLAFPDADMLGVDILVPKIDWVIENSHKIKGWVLTHGHEDHIGGLPYMLKLLPKIPMYGARLTLGLLRGKFDEFGLSEGDVDLHEITPDDRIKISRNFTVDFFRMTHSIPDNSGLVIHTPIGRIVHSGDFKLDYNPSDGKTSHLYKLAQAGVDGVLALISDSTNAERPGYTPSEKDVMEAVAEIVSKTKGRVIVTAFSSHIHRLQNFVRVAEQFGRRVVVEGRSMIKNTRIAQELGYLKSNQPFASTDDIGGLQDDKVLFLCTGSQGQPMAALSRLAAGSHRKIQLKPGDTVIMSSNPIPGNEEGREPGHQPTLRTRHPGAVPACLPGPHFGARESGGAQAHPRPDPTQVLHPLARRDAPIRSTTSAWPRECRNRPRKA